MAYFTHQLLVRFPQLNHPTTRSTIMKFIAATGLFALALSQVAYSASIGITEGSEEAQVNDELSLGGVAGYLGKRIATRVASHVGSGIGHIFDGSGIGGTFGGRGHGGFKGSFDDGFGGGFAGNFRGRGAGNFRDILGGEIKGGGKGSGGLGFGNKYRGGLKVDAPKLSYRPEEYTEGSEWADGFGGGRVKPGSIQVDPIPDRKSDGYGGGGPGSIQVDPIPETAYD
ncbi:hypothetical protein K7432_017432 [Basidiobolus ranarum]|uniref:Uncharacterized protein n=1 Tax=Basidiobolus ranarum TaxID=34480 RepID=A0ABR2WDD6_9FUNG